MLLEQNTELLLRINLADAGEEEEVLSFDAPYGSYSQKSTEFCNQYTTYCAVIQYTSK
jgi:hypothetical protein